jgi:hypothetical protein
LNPKLGRILYFADRFVLGVIDFSSILRAFKEAGISHPGSWNSEDLQEVEEILRGEIDKAHAIFNISEQVRN